MWVRVLQVLGRYLGIAVRNVFTPANATAGAIAAGANVAAQVYEHQTDWRKYNWPSVGFDFCMGALGYGIAKYIFHRWPAPILNAKARYYIALDKAIWVNFTKQETAFAIYFLVLWAWRADYSNAEVSNGLKAGGGEFGLGLSQAVVMQSFLFSPAGRAMFPAGYGDPRVVVLDNILDFIINVAVRKAFDVIARSEEARSVPPTQS